MLDLPLQRRLELVTLLLAAAAMLINFVALILVIGDVVVTFWAMSALLLAASVALRIASWRMDRSSYAKSLTGWVKLLRGVSAFGVGLLCFLAAFEDLSASYQPLNPAGPNGCRVVVREHSFLFSGGGSAYATRFGIGFQVSSWTTDDGYQPVATGAYSLTWSGDGGLLQLVGGTDPVWPALHGIPCS